MPQLTPVMGGTKPNAQIIALDSRKSEQVISDKQYLKVLQLSDLLSRHLQVTEILQVFSTEVKNQIPHAGYRFVNDELSQPIRAGRLEQHSIHYQLSMEDRKLGKLSVFRKQAFTSTELCLFEELTCALVYPLKNAMMYLAAVRSAFRDPLTGINNRAAMDRLLPREVRLAKRHDQRLALMVMDLDGFKDVNDNLGHDQGDQLLCSVAQNIKTCLRETDMLFRYGGDEFVVALPYTDSQGALDVAQRVLQQVEILVSDKPYQTQSLGLSIGLTMLQAGDDFARFFKRADQALYRAKKGGKHRVIII